jgi:hypothetical protein
VKEGAKERLRGAGEAIGQWGKQGKMGLGLSNILPLFCAGTAATNVREGAENAAETAGEPKKEGQKEKGREEAHFFMAKSTSNSAEAEKKAPILAGYVFPFRRQGQSISFTSHSWRRHIPPFPATP